MINFIRFNDPSAYILRSPAREGGPGGMVYVRNYDQDRDGHSVQVSSYYRSPPGSGVESGGSAGWWRGAPSPKISADAYQSNGRMVHSLLGTSDDAPMASLFADSLRGGKGKSVAEYSDFLNQLDSRDPKRAERFDLAVHKLGDGTTSLPSNGADKSGFHAMDIKRQPSGRPTPLKTLPTIYNPTGGTERNDKEGGGWYGAKRIGHKHKGVDITTKPSDPVLAPIDGVVEHRGPAYDEKKYPERRHLRSIHIRGTGKYKDINIKMFYGDGSGPKVGENVKAGTTVVDRAQDVGKAHKKPAMTPHIHMEVEWKGNRIDPARVLSLGKGKK